MNERILELAIQATSTEYGADNGFDRVTFDKEKFAELIIEDCICVVDGAVYHRHPASSYVDLIREHFAVE
jgi:hypothetical protein